MKHIYLISLTLGLLCIVHPLYASYESYDVWDGTASAVTPSGTTYHVNNAEQLAWIAQQTEAGNTFQGKTVELEANLDLDGANRLRVWTPIGTEAHPFAGTFNGNNHLIRGLMTINAEDGVGLFGHIGAAGKVSNLGISGGCIVAVRQRRVGALAGVCAGAVADCWSMAEIAMSGNVGGGLIGELQSGGTLTDAYCCALVRNAGDTVGVLVGRNSGHITRAYTTGYAKNGCAFVGYSGSGAKYTKCFYDRKLYYQEPGAVSTGLKGLDEITEMFVCMNGIVSSHWTTSNNLYPQLKGFANTDASRLSVAPVRINTSSVDPINHANDLTENFIVDIAGGEIKWQTQELVGADWIIFDGSESVTVIRPCTETDVLATASYRNEQKTVYFRPRRVDDLKPGVFYGKSQKSEVCYDGNLAVKETMQSAESDITASDGFPPRYYMVVRYGYDDSKNAYPLDTLPVMEDEAELINWYNEGTLHGDSAGDYELHLFVHDSRCVPAWTECKGTVKYTVLPELNPGAIPTKWDTLYLGDDGTVTFKVTEITAAEGGKAPYKYAWLGSDNPSAPKLVTTLVGDLTYIFKAPTEKQDFYRFVTDDTDCPGKFADGVSSATVFAKFREGRLNQQNTEGLTKRVFCSMNEAFAYTITATKASGGSGTYQYQWFMQSSGAALTPVAGATQCDLPLAGLTLEVGKEYTFVRKAKDNTRFTEWTQSGPAQVILISSALKPGAIITRHDTLMLDENGQAEMKITSVTPASAGSGEYTYTWRYTKDGEDMFNTGAEAGLTYTFTDPMTAQTFYRYVTDGTPCGDGLSDGVYTLTVFAKVTAGDIYDESSWGSDRMEFCTVEDAKAHTVSASSAKGGSGKYLYQWYTVSGETQKAISGATLASLPLSTVPLSAGNEYTFIRKVKDDTRFGEWMQSSGKQTIYIKKELDPGAIESENRGRQCVTPDNRYADISIKETKAASGEGELDYRWLRITGSYETVVGYEPSYKDYWYVSGNTDMEYTYVREVSQDGCGWVRSKGQVTMSYGIKDVGVLVHTICYSQLPYTMHWTDSQGKEFTHTFKTGGESDQWVVTDNSSPSGCPADTTITIAVVERPTISTEETEAKFCQNESEIAITYTQESGDADMFVITYSDVLAKYMGRKDTTGHIVTPGRIIIRNVPPLPDEEGKWLELQVGATGGAEDLHEVECNTDMIHVNIETRLGGYLHSKFSRVLYVDNNPDNGEVPAPKLHFKDYKWYKNGNHLADHDGEQYYHENGQELNGVFYVVLTDDNGNTYKSCEIVMPEDETVAAAAPSVIYPVPVGAGEPLTVSCNGGKAEISSTTGETVLTVECTGPETTVPAPRIAGIYYVRITHSDGRVQTEKLIVK